MPLCLGLAACGARSSLLPGEATGEETSGTASGGTGGAGAGSTTTNSGGAGGTVAVSCAALVVDGPPLSPIPGLGGNQLLLPSLVRTATDGSRAGLVFSERPESPDSFLQASSVALDDPWGAWPSSLGASAFHGSSSGFVTGPDQEGRFSMLTPEDDCCGGGPVGMVVWSPQAGVSGAKGQFFNDVPPGIPVLVSANGGDYLAGFQHVLAGGLHHLTLARVVFGGGPTSDAETSACSLDTGLSGAAIPLGGGFLAAQSNGRPFGKCLTDDLSDGPATRLQILTVPGGAAQTTLAFEVEEPDTYLFQTHLTPAPGGAWAAWERIPFEPPFDRRLQLLRLDSAGLPVDGKVLEVGFGTVGSPIAIAALGPLLAIATTREEQGSPRVLDVHLLADDGTLVSEATFAVEESAFDMDANVALLGSPAGDRLLVAWAESSAIDNDDRRVRVARLACAGP